MLGVVSMGLLSGGGRVWMLGTDEVYRCGRDLLISGPPMFERWLETFSELSNVVAVDNRRAIRLLKKWEFQFDPDSLVYGGVEFVRFSLSRAAVKDSRDDHDFAIQEAAAFA